MVEWAPVYIQVAPEGPARGETYEPEVLFNRGYHTFQRAFSKIRVRSALQNIPALVTIEVAKNYE